MPQMPCDLASNENKNYSRYNRNTSKIPGISKKQGKK